MLRITLKGIRGHLVRFLLTTLAVLLGVSFVVASFVLRDGLKETFNGLIEDINAQVDVEVRGYVEFSESDFQDDPVFDESVLGLVEGVDGVADAMAGVGFPGIIPIDSDGEPLPTFGPPLLGVTWSDSSMSPVTLTEGSAPQRGEFVIDIDSAELHDFQIGQTYDIIFPEGRQQFTLSGLMTFGDENALLGAVLTAYDFDEFRELTDTEGLLQTISVRAEEGVAPATLASRIQEVLPDNAEAVTTEAVVAEDQADFGVIIDALGWFFTGFGLVSLLVAAFLITNIFNITIGQRLRELALMRAIGATTSQIRGSVLTEAVTIGLIASVLGIGVGAGLAWVARALMNAAGFSLPEFDINIAPLTVVTAFIIGLGVTIAASLLPAFHAGRVPPAAAVQEGFHIPDRPRARLIVGAILTVFGAVLMALGLGGAVSGIGLAVALGFGSVLVFVGVTTLSPLFAAPIVSAVGSPLKKLPWLKVSGLLAQQNSARSARTTAAAAGALMIGLALTVGASVFGQSLKDTISSILDESVTADFIAQPNGFGNGGFGAGFAERLRDTDEFGQVAAFRFGNIRVDGDIKNVIATNFDQLDGMIDASVISGSFSDAPPLSIALHQDPARDLGVTAGDSITVEFASGESVEMPVAAVYEDAQILDNWAIDLATWDRFFSLDSDLFVMGKSADGVDAQAARAAIEAVAEDFPQIQIQDRTEFLASQEAQVDGMLIVINVFLLFAFVIAILGILITMTLMVVERTREIGMLRAVGMTARQVRSMVRWEAVLIAVFGAILGTVLGLVFGWAAVVALPDSVVNTFAVPWGSLVLYAILAGLGGMVAGLYPAIRAARMNILEAISYQ
ncbi:MAG: FtsX-like permease family protein [Acidimicrobiales bacterium]